MRLAAASKTHLSSVVSHSQTRKALCHFGFGLRWMLLSANRNGPLSFPCGSIPSLHFGEALLSSSSHVMAMGGRRMDRIADGESAFKPLSLQLDMFAFRRSEPVSISVEERYGTQSTRLP